ncbi:MAG: MATE family efflux transporter [Rhodospirillales bacterium]|nr:MATE family efflux transporter [Rhodospirillales bacterium]
MLRLNEWDRQTWRLVVPIILTNITIPLLGIVDTAVVGHLPGPHYLGAVAVGSLVFSIVYASMFFLRMGTTGLTSQAVGANDDNEVRAWMVRGCLLAVVIGLALIALQLPIAVLIFSWTGGSDDVLPLAESYFFIRIWSAPATLLNFVILGWFIGIQNTRPALLTQLLLNCTNIILDLWFVIGLGFGVAGVAYATLISEIAGALFGLWLVHRYALPMAGQWNFADALKKNELLRMLQINGNIFIRSLCLQISFFAFTAYGARQSDVILASNTILLKFTMFTAYALDAFANAAEALAGKAYGANNRNHFRAAVLASSRWALLFSLLFALIFLATGPVLIDALTSVEAVRQTARLYLPWLVVSPLVAVWSFQLDGIYVGATKTVIMRNAMLISMVVFFLSLLLLVPAMGNHGLWLAFMIFFAMRGLTLGAWYPRIEKSLNPAAS